MYQELGISNNVIELVNRCEKGCLEEFKKIDQQTTINSLKVLNAFHNNRISDLHFGSTTGCGYGDVGRDTIENVFAEVLGAEDALVRSQFISGTHALTVALFAFLRPGDTMLSICGKPYDTLDEVIGISENASSLKSYKLPIACIPVPCLVQPIVAPIRLKRLRIVSSLKSVSFFILKASYKAILKGNSYEYLSQAKITLCHIKGASIVNFNIYPSFMFSIVYLKS
jgi:hypothetical protein